MLHPLGAGERSNRAPRPRPLDCYALASWITPKVREVNRKALANS
jgi:hypothetical protein